MTPGGWTRYSWILMVVLVAACAPAPSGPNPTLSIQTGVDASGWVSVPAGQFLLGPHNTQATTDAYQIMATDVTNAQYAAYLNWALAAGKISLAEKEVMGYYPGDLFHGRRHEIKIEAGNYMHVTLGSPGLRVTFDGKTFGVQSGYENHPMAMVTWFGAKAYCDFNNWRLPSEAEWEKAARGSDGRAFPWGNEIAPNQANYYDSNDPTETTFGKQGDTTPVGFYNGKTYSGYTTAAAASPYGAYDMAGNVWQWTADIYQGVHYRYLRGGSKDTYAYNLRAWTRNSAAPEYASPDVGFRCAR